MPTPRTSVNMWPASESRASDDVARPTATSTARNTRRTHSEINKARTCRPPALPSTGPPCPCPCPAPTHWKICVLMHECKSRAIIGGVTEPTPVEGLRVSDAERTQVQDRLRRAHDAGQLDLYEF